ncbi:hypothetical protein VTL71DRAFT_14501 [Oculimacula yallundae]|uniref:Uncharacterized protein n=1 Tax=Oculimacula yallundae TaxID=86028 RepID=A0ABR4CJC3_9HELO
MKGALDRMSCLTQVKFGTPVDFEKDGHELLVTSSEEATYVGAPSKDIDDAWNRLIWGGTLPSPSQKQWSSGEMTTSLIGTTARAGIREGLICSINFTVSIRFVRLCIEIILRNFQSMERCIQSLMCWGSTAVTPIKFFPGYGHGYVKSDATQTCRKFEPIREFVSERFNGSLRVSRPNGDSRCQLWLSSWKHIEFAHGAPKTRSIDSRDMRRLLVASLLIPLSFAVECNWQSFTAVSQSITSQEVLNVLTQGCTTIINAAIIVEPDYIGSFVWRNITDISGFVRFGNSDGDSQITSIDMPDLVSFNATTSLTISKAPKLMSVSFQRLRTVNGSGGLVVRDAPNARLSFPSLETATSLEIYGGVSSMDFPLLAYIDNSLRLCSVIGCDPPTAASPIAAKYDVNFPSLIQVSSLKIDANVLSAPIRSLSLPNLSKVGPSNTNTNNTNTNTTEETGLDIHSWGESFITFNLPKLAEVTNKLDIQQYFGSILLPSLTKVPAIVNIHGYVEQILSLPALSVVGELYVSGRISAVSLPVLSSIKRMVIYRADGARFASCIHEILDFEDHLRTHEQETTHPFICRFNKPKEPLSVGVICAIAGGAAFVAGMLCIYFILWRRSQRKKAAKKKKEAEEYELQQRYEIADCDSVAETEVGSLRSERTVVQTGVRGYVRRGAGDVDVVS